MADFGRPTVAVFGRLAGRLLQPNRFGRPTLILEIGLTTLEGYWGMFHLCHGNETGSASFFKFILEGR